VHRKSFGTFIGFILRGVALREIRRFPPRDMKLDQRVDTLAAGAGNRLPLFDGYARSLTICTTVLMAHRASARSAQREMVRLIMRILQVVSAFYQQTVFGQMECGGNSGGASAYDDDAPTLRRYRLGYRMRARTQ
jgi:hypothetical protein